MQVRAFFSPKDAVKAVQTLKGHNWTQHDLLDLLTAISHNSSDQDKLPSIALKALYAQVQSVTNPLIRHCCLQILNEKTEKAESNTYEPFIITSLLGTGDVEPAYSRARSSSNRNRMVCEEQVSLKLIKCGADDVQPSTNESWARLFEAAVDKDSFENARWLWMNKPVALNSFAEATSIGEPVLLKFIELIGRHQDLALLKRVINDTKYELPFTSGSLAAALSCYIAPMKKKSQVIVQFLEEYELLLAEHVAFQDLRQISDQLVSEVRVICEHADRITPLVGNLLLQALYRHQTSQTVLHFYRYLVDHRHFQPNRVTAQLLANTAYRLGNSKLLSYEIWREMRDYDLDLDRKFYESMVMCQLVGTNYLSVQFFMAEMARDPRILTRKHIKRMVYNKFERLGNTTPLLALGSANVKLKFTKFDVDEAIAESPHSEQAIANAEIFKRGKISGDKSPLEVLDEMILFDQRRNSR